MGICRDSFDVYVNRCLCIDLYSRLYQSDKDYILLPGLSQVLCPSVAVAVACYGAIEDCKYTVIWFHSVKHV